MTSSPVEAVRGARAMSLSIGEDALTFELIDGRTLSVPIVWFPRLLHATPDELHHFEIEGDGGSVWWPDLDDGVEIAHLLLGWPSGEGPKSLRKWLDERAAQGKKATSA